MATCQKIGTYFLIQFCDEELCRDVLLNTSLESAHYSDALPIPCSCSFLHQDNSEKHSLVLTLQSPHQAKYLCFIDFIQLLIAVVGCGCSGQGG